MRPERRAHLYAAIAAVALLVVLIIAGEALGLGWTPVAPQPSGFTGGTAITTAQSAGAGNYVIDETFAFNQSFTPPSHLIGCSPSCTWTISQGWSNLTLSIGRDVPTGAFVPSGPLGSYVNLIQTHGCGAPCPPVYITCDNFGPVQAPISGLKCLVLQITWSGGSPVVGSVPTFNVERVQTWVVTVGNSWTISPCSKASTGIGVMDWGPGFYNSNIVNQIATWTTIQASVAMVFPSGENYLPSTLSIVDQTTSTSLTTSQYYAMVPKYVLIQYLALPTPGFTLGSEATATNISHTLFFQLSLSCGSPGGIGGGGTNRNGTVSVPTNIPPVQQLPGTIVLVLGNTTSINAGNLSSSVTWTNTGSSIFMGTFLLEAPFLPGSTNLRLFENGQPASPGTTYTSNDSITVVQGTAPVTNGSSIIFESTYQKGSTYRTNSVVLVVNGVSLTAGDITFVSLAAISGTLLVLYAVYYRTYKASENLLETAGGLLLLGVLAWGWISL